jgi:G3E family GTPase
VSETTSIPVTIVTGFLGAGKTSLLNTLLRASEMAASLVLINEWGEVGLDHLLIEKVDGDVILLGSGCLCCTLRGDLVDALHGCLDRRDAGAIAPFQRIIIETTGLADPSPILHALMADSGLAARLRLASIVTLVEAINGAATIAQHRVAARQVALADVLAITKSDLLDPMAREASLERLRGDLSVHNPAARIVDVAAGGFGVGDFAAQEQSVSPHDARALESQPAASIHNAWIKTRIFRNAQPLDPVAFGEFLELLGGLLGPRLLRVKGLVALADDPLSPLVLHGAQHLLHPPRRVSQWPDSDRTTRIVMIVEGVPAATIDRLWAALTHTPAIDAPDMAALANNPLRPSRGGLLG